MTGVSALPSVSILGDRLPKTPPIAVFSKIYQELNLSYAACAEITASIGLDGIDCPVRPGGQVLPERAPEDLPAYQEALAKHHLRILLLTTAIQNPATPHAESILRTAAKLGVKYYRLGYWNYKADQPPALKLAEIKSQLIDLAAMNKQLGVCALLQNHAGTGLVGAKLRDYYDIVQGLDPAQIGIAFDIGHALNELNEGWRNEFKKLQPHFAVAYLKDWKRGEGFVPFGKGDISSSGYGPLLRKLNPSHPLSLHIEYKWEGSAPRSSDLLVRALRADLQALKSWWTQG